MNNNEAFKEGPKNDKRPDRGQALVEMMLMLPVLLVLFAGLIELGFSFYDYLIVVNAAREGARFASKLPDYPDEEVFEITNRAAQNLEGFVLRDGAGEPIRDAEGRLITNSERASVIVSWLSAPVPEAGYDYEYSILEGYPAPFGKAALPVGDQVGPVHRSRITEARIDEIAADVEAALQGATFQQDAKFVIVEVVYDHAQVVGLFKIGEIIPDPIALSSLTMMRVSTSARQPGCAVCPIALNWGTINGVPANTNLGDIYEGTGPGNFGWLAWPADTPGDRDDAGYVADSLRNCEMSRWDYASPADFEDTILNLQDLMLGNTGIGNSDEVTAVLESYVASGQIIRVAVWETVETVPSQVRYVLKGYAKVRITGYNLAQKYISAILVSYSESCD